MDGLSAKPRPPAANRREATARHRGCVLFGYFLLHKQEKVTRPPGRRTEAHRDVSRSSRNSTREINQETSRRRIRIKPMPKNRIVQPHLDRKEILARGRRRGTDRPEMLAVDVVDHSEDDVVEI